MKAYERLPNYVPRTDGIKYDDYCKLVAGKEDYDAETIQELHVRVKKGERKRSKSFSLMFADIVLAC